MDLLYRRFGDNAIAQCAVAMACVLVLSLVLTPLVRLIARRTGMLAPPHDHSIHTVPIPRLGGVAIYLAFVTGILLFEPLMGDHLDTLSHAPVTAGHLITQIRGLLLGATVAVIVGALDDYLNPPGLRPGLKFLGQILAAATAIAGGLRPVEGISNPFAVNLFYAHPEKHKQLILWSTHDPHVWAPLIAVVFTVFWIVGMMNTVNFLDGMDGLAGGVVTIAAILLAIWSSGVHKDVGGPIIASQVLVLPPLILAAALIGFLVYNWWPASIIMGDSGAQFAGFTIGVLAILGPAKIGTALLILAVPILDLAWVFIRRPTSGRRFFSADREHLHHRLLDLGLSQRRIVLMFYAVCSALGIIDLLLSRIGKLLAFLVVAVATAGLLVRVARRHTPSITSKPPVPRTSAHSGGPSGRQ